MNYFQFSDIMYLQCNVIFLYFYSTMNDCSGEAHLLIRSHLAFESLSMDD